MTVAVEFLRSINISADLARPERLAHFHPTAKSVRVLEAVAFGRPGAATMVIAAYGSGKSIAAAVGALLVGNTPTGSTVLSPIAERLAGVDSALARRFAARQPDAAARGLVIALHGHVPDLAAAIAAQARLDGSSFLDGTLERLVARARRRRRDRIAIVWDEFGRHLEGLIADGRAADLLDVQTLAEWAARQARPHATLTLLLHQNLLNYASRLNQSARSSWRKIEGRFEVLRFVEDSRELYQLIGRLVATRPLSAGVAAPCRAIGARMLELGWFHGFADADEVARLVAQAAPLTPGALHALPLVAARVAQQERSVFSFLHQAERAGTVGIEDVYRYFAEAMRTDSGLGGTQRRWLEAESARDRAGDEIECALLAAACLLQLGAGGERRRLPREALALAVAAGSPWSMAETEAAIDRLLERKLLLHRLRNDDISIWHGADVDIRQRLDEQKARLHAGFDLAGFLAAECPPPLERPLRHNANHRATPCHSWSC
jgi:hypothetical protein